MQDRSTLYQTSRRAYQSAAFYRDIKSIAPLVRALVDGGFAYLNRFRKVVFHNGQ